MKKTCGKKIAQKFLTFSKKNWQKLSYQTLLEALTPQTRTQQQPPMETKETLPFLASLILVRPAQLNTTSLPGPRQFTLCKNNGPRRPYQSSPVMQRDRIRAGRVQVLKERTLMRQVHGSQRQESPSQKPPMHKTGQSVVTFTHFIQKQYHSSDRQELYNNPPPSARNKWKEHEVKEIRNNPSETSHFIHFWTISASNLRTLQKTVNFYHYKTIGSANSYFSTIYRPSEL